MGKIIWLASYPKSGNTWVRVFLANLFSGSDEPVGINELDQFCSSFTARAFYDALAGRPARELSPRDVLALRQQLQQVFCDNCKESGFLKTHSRFGDQFGLPLISPEHTAGAIYVVRNPLDVAVSASTHFGVSVEEMVKHMADPDMRTADNDRHVMDYLGSWSQHVASWTIPAHPKIHVVRYEDLYTDPRKAFGDIVKFLGIQPPEGRVERCVQYSSFRTLTEQERKEGFRERSKNSESFFRRGRPGEGRETLSPELIASIIATHSEQMKRFGYI